MGVHGQAAPLTADEIAGLKALILPLRKKGWTLRRIAEKIKRKQDLVERIVYRHCPELRRRDYVLSSHSFADFDDVPKMRDTGKECHRCKQTIGKTESYHWTTSGWEHSMDCKKGKGK